MTYTGIFELATKLARRTTKRSRLVALAILASFTLLPMQPAQAQSADTWKSIAIIGGSTAAGAYLGHKVAGPTGALVGAGVGATAGYAIDRRRRRNEYYNYGYDGRGYYPNSGYYGSDGGYYGNGYYGGAYDSGAYPSGYVTNNYRRNRDRCAGR